MGPRATAMSLNLSALAAYILPDTTDPAQAASRHQAASTPAPHKPHHVIRLRPQQAPRKPHHAIRPRPQQAAPTAGPAEAKSCHQAAPTAGPAQSASGHTQAYRHHAQQALAHVQVGTPEAPVARRDALHQLDGYGLIHAVPVVRVLRLLRRRGPGAEARVHAHAEDNAVPGRNAACPSDPRARRHRRINYDGIYIFIYIYIYIYI